MFDVAPQLQTALDSAQARLGDAAGAAARAQTNLGAATTDLTMAQFAQRAIFTEALLSAMHARFAELKTVSK
ncbi:MAG: hypothetical protein ABI182_06460 [Candidatus Baltobacteraceae bacterium]